MGQRKEPFPLSSWCSAHRGGRTPDQSNQNKPNGIFRWVRRWNEEISPDRRWTAIRDSIPNQENHGFYPWVNWSSGTGCSPFVGVSWEPRALPVGLHQRGENQENIV